MNKILYLIIFLSTFLYGDTHLGGEASNFGRVDYYCMHNIVYMEYRTGENYRIKMLQPLIRDSKEFPYWRCGEFLNQRNATRN